MLISFFQTYALVSVFTSPIAGWLLSAYFRAKKIAFLPSVLTKAKPGPNSSKNEHSSKDDAAFELKLMVKT